MDKELILETGEKYFFAKRYNDVKLDIIADDLKIKKPSLYYYFSDKKDFFLQTIKYSMEKYMENLKKITDKKDIKKFIDWYLMFPIEKKNLFAISFQKGFMFDTKINSLIFGGKNNVNKIIEDFLAQFNISKVKIYIILNLLEKFAQDNCIDGYCLKFPIEEIKKEINNFIKN